ncbi:unnamed protein product [Ranitomeya imitator]|uniref:Reverse transcriptase RNase H-like domain-containing protein n=1 Tax=Ranitomeya imitator TaxID=111125 RepID=A0ABN9L4E6_9NEOB|nr:unnamed protein product [Ranitomeya imitator]
MDPVKVQAIHDWIQPTSVNGLQKFLGFANFYRRFNANFSSVVKPLTDLTKKGADVTNWSSAAVEAFQELKRRFTSAPVLRQPDVSLPFQVEVDASEIGAGAVLSQRESDGSLMKPCAFFSRKFSPADRNYDVGNRELLAMKWAFEEWRHWLEGAKHRVVVLTDHKNLIYLESAKRLNPRQARWSLFFSRFDFVVSYLPGSKNVKADALSRSFSPDSPGVLELVGILKEGVILSAISPDLRRVLREFQADRPDRCPVGKLFVPDGWTMDMYCTTKKKIEHFTKWFQESVKLQDRKKPVNNLTYPAFQHPLAPPYPFPYKFLINQPDKCKNRKPFLVIMILGLCYDSESRHAIRETWERIQDLLGEESEIFGDIVQQDFMDTYYNLTLKTLMDNLVHHLLNPDLPVRQNYFTGYIVANTGPLRSKAYKWYVPEEVYPNKTYPPYCSGTGYVFSADLAKKIYDVAQEIRVIPMEDAFMGICLHELHIPPTKPPKDKFNGHRINYDRCKFKNVITVHHYARSELRSIWADFQANKSLNC